MTDSSFDDWLAITGALNRLAAIIDGRTWDELEAVMLVDAHCYGQIGLNAIIAKVFQQSLGGCGPTQHLLGNYKVSVNGDVATSRCLVRAFHLEASPVAEAPRTFVWMGAYLDRWSRTASGWKMSERKTETSLSLGDREILKPG
jgi:hypothetical protein